MTPTRPSLTGHQAKGGYLQPNSVTGLHPCVSPHTHPRAEDGAPRHPRQGSGPSLTEPSPTPPRPPRSARGGKRSPRGGGEGPGRRGTRAGPHPHRATAAAGPGPARLPSGTLPARALRLHGNASPLLLSPVPGWDSFSSGVRSSPSWVSISLPPGPRSAPRARPPSATAERTAARLAAPQTRPPRSALPRRRRAAAAAGRHVTGAAGRKRPQPQRGAAAGRPSAAIFGEGSGRGGPPICSAKAAAPSLGAGGLSVCLSV